MGPFALSLVPFCNKNSTLQEWDEECARKHLGAVKDSVATHKELHDLTLMGGEHPVNELDLAGVEQPPGLGLTGVLTQQCCVVFTNKKRLVFTQVYFEVHRY